jgi:Zn-finger nucleic acid-binding protein
VLHCPVDHTELVDHFVDSVAFATCSKCNGLWLPRNARAELLDPAQVQSSTRSADDASRGGRKRYGCPRCKKSLTAERVEGIEIDRCPRCDGIWLDAGEYDAVRQRIETKREATAAAATEVVPKEGGALSATLDVVFTLIEAIFR